MLMTTKKSSCSHESESESQTWTGGAWPFLWCDRTPAPTYPLSKQHRNAESQAVRDSGKTASLYLFSVHYVPDIIHILQLGAGEMAQRTWIQSPTPTWWLMTICNSSSKGPVPTSNFHGHQACIWRTYIHTGTTHAHKTEEIKSTGFTQCSKPTGAWCCY